MARPSAERRGRAVYVPYALPDEIVEAEISGAHAQLRDDSDAERSSGSPPFARISADAAAARSSIGRRTPIATGNAALLITALENQGIAAEVEPLIDAQGEGRRRATSMSRKRRTVLSPVSMRRAAMPSTRSIIVPSSFRHWLERRGSPGASATIIGNCDVAFTAVDNGIDVDIATLRKPPPELAALVNAENLARLSHQPRALGHAHPPEITIGKASLRLPPGAFLQATKAGEEILAALVMENLGKAKKVADLFSGVGVFALRLCLLGSGLRRRQRQGGHRSTCRGGASHVRPQAGRGQSPRSLPRALDGA